MGSTYHRAFALTALVTCGLAAGAARANTLVVHGAGEGHGVGMSQDGALGYAQHGYPYQAILAHYYSGTALGQAPTGWMVRVLVDGKVRRVPLEAYVRGVVANEMSSSWPLAALEAQAVASRTYALTSHAGGAKFDVYADARSQVYRGRASETPQTNLAVKATAGQVVTYAGQPAITYFFAASGGMTEDVQDAFPGAAPEPWLRAVPDPFETGPLHSWSISLSFAVAAHDLRGLVRGSFLGIEVLARGYSPRIISAAVLGSKGSTTITGDELAARLGLYDTWAYFSVSGPHGVQAEPDRSGPAPTAAQTPTPPQTPPAATSPDGGTGAVGAAGSSAVHADGGTAG